jgi:hypothetical protein
VGVAPAGPIAPRPQEDLHTDPRATFETITEHLGIRPWHPPVWNAYNAATSSGMPTDVVTASSDLEP